MRESWDHYMKIGIVHPMCFPECMQGEGPIVETVTQIATDEFFGAIDIIWIKDPEVRRQVGSIVKQGRMQVTFAAQSVQLLNKVDLNALDEAERQRAVDLVKQCADWAVDVNASRLSILSGKDPGEAKREEALELLVDSTKQICRHVREKAGIPVALKVFDYDVEKNCLAGPAELCKRYAEAVRQDFPDFGLIHDLSHIPLCHETTRHAVTTLKDYLVQMHMGNSCLQKGNPLYGDLHPIFGIEGGDSDVPELTEYLSCLFEVGFLAEGKRPFVGFEMKPHAGVTSEMVIANAKRTFKEAWVRLSLPCC